LLSLPTGQAVAAEITDSAPEEQKQFLRDGFANDTPLWYYVLAEAKIKGGGNHLGPVGTRIVAETLVGLISNTKDNVLEENPNLKFSMAAMLTFINDINPLGD